jgi:hypothetical protein
MLDGAKYNGDGAAARSTGCEGEGFLLMNGRNHGNERRLYDRLNLRWKIVLHRSPNDLPITSTTENISSRGLFFVSPEPFTPSERLKTFVYLPRMERPGTPAYVLECEAEVVHVARDRQAGFGVGCRFHQCALRKTSPVDSVGVLS